MDILLDDSFDLPVQPQLARTSDTDLIVQRIRSAIALFEGEWRLDTTAGLPWLDWLQTVPPPLDEIAAVVRVEIADVLGVDRVSTLDVSLNDNDVITIQGTVTSLQGDTFEFTTEVSGQEPGHPIFSTNANLLN